MLVKTVTEWARDLIIISLAFAFTEMLLPANDLQKFARVVMGIVMIAVILGSILDISRSMDDALESQAEFSMGQAYALNVPSYVARGERITQAGLEIAGSETETKVTRQIQSIARLASGADEAHAEIGFASSGNIRHIYVTLRGLNTLALGTSRSDSDNFEERTASSRKELTDIMEARVISAVRDFYGFSNDVMISVSVSSLQ